jgi:tetratricopeptide (TPR) repeat protein
MKNQLLLIVCLSAAMIGMSSCASQTPVTVRAAPNIEAGSGPAVDSRIKKAELMIQNAPQDVAGYNALGVAYIRMARETGDFSLNNKAETAINKALELDASNISSKKFRASLMLTFHRFAEGLDAGKALQKDNPKDPFVYGILTDANVELGNYKEAVDAAQQMVNLRPGMESYARVSYVRSLHGDSAGAIEAMKMAAQTADPQDKEAKAWCMVHLGDEYFKIGNFADAEKSYDLALETFPNYHFALAGKGKVRAAAGDNDAAIKFLTDAQTRVPLTETVIILGDLYAKTGNPEKAKQQYDLAEVIERNFGNIDQRRLALLWADNDEKLDQALDIAEREHNIRKDIFTADIYAWCLYKKGNFAEAEKAVAEAMRLKTKDARIYYHAGMIAKENGKSAQAAAYVQTALQLDTAFDFVQTDRAKVALAALGR